MKMESQNVEQEVNDMKKENNQKEQQGEENMVTEELSFNRCI